MALSLSRITNLLYRYKSLLILALAALLAELAYAILNLSAMPIYVAKTLHAGTYLGYIGGTFLAIEALSRPGMGALGDKIGRKKLLLLGPALTAITSYLTIIYQGNYVVPYLIVLRFVDGLGSGALWMNAFAAVGDVVEERNRSTAMSVLNVTYMGGMALAFLFGGKVNAYFGTFTASFYLASILFVLSFIAFLFFPKTTKHTHIDIPGHETPPDFKPSHLFRSFKEVPDMVAMAMVTFLGMGMLTLIVKLYAMDHLGLSEVVFGQWVAPIAILMGVCAIPLGRLGDKVGKTTAVCWGLLATSIAMWMLALSKNFVLVGIAGLLIGIGFTVAFPAWNALVLTSTNPNRRGEVLGAVGLAQGLAAMSGTLLGPMIYFSDALSFPKLGVVNYNVPFWLSAILISAGTLICFTWVCAKRASSSKGDQFTCSQRYKIVALFVLGFIALAGWIGYQYTTPIAPERVTWVWVQQLARNKPQKAEKYSVKSTQGWDQKQIIKTKAKEYHKWIYNESGSYQVTIPKYIGKNKAEVEVKFHIPPKDTIKETVILCKTKPRGDWKVCGIK